MIKSIIKILSMVIIAVSCFSFTAMAQELTSFTIDDVSSKNNRIFTTTVSGNGKDTITVGTFVFDYDPEVIAFRDVNKIYDSTTVKYTDNYGKLTVFFLDETGVDLSSLSELFTVDFKAENLTNNTQITLSTADCINTTAEEIQSKCNGCTVSLITATSAGNSAESSSSKTQSSKAESSANSSAKSSNVTSNATNNQPQKSNNNSQKTTAENNIPQENTDSKSKTFNVFAKDNNLKTFMIGAVAMLIIITVLAITYFIGKNSNNGKNNDR